MASTDDPKFTELSRTDAVALLQRNHVGRVAFAFHDRVDIEPISYVFDESWVYGRTSPGAKLTTVQHFRWIAFEVDEIEDRFNWRSVVVHGAIYLLERSERDPARAEYAHALDVIRSLDANALSPSDPAPHRTQLFRMHADEIVGRAASSR